MRVTISEKDFPLREVLFSYMVRAIEREKALKAAGKGFL